MRAHPCFYESRAKNPEVRFEHATYVAMHPEREEIQDNGRIRRWAFVAELSRYVRVIPLPDGETIYNGFIDRDFAKGYRR